MNILIPIADEVSRDATSLEAAKIMGNLWCDSPTECVDVWGCEWLSKEFIKEFLTVCKERGETLKALQIKWMAHNCPGDEYDWCTNDCIDQWIIEWAAESINSVPFLAPSKDHKAIVKAYRKMFQSFIKSISESD